MSALAKVEVPVVAHVIIDAPSATRTEARREIPRVVQVAITLWVVALLFMAAMTARQYGAYHEWSWGGLTSSLLQIPVVILVVLAIAAKLSGGHLPHLGADLLATRADVVTHERGHQKVLAHHGISSRISISKCKNGLWKGETIPWSWSKLDKLPPAQKAAVYLGGEVATGTKAGCRDDHAAVRGIAKTGAQLREAYIIARKALHR